MGKGKGAEIGAPVAIELGDFDDGRALNALLQVATDSNEDQMILDSCGESIAEIWVKRNFFDSDLYKKIAYDAQWELYMYIKSNKPEWIQEFNLDPP